MAYTPANLAELTTIHGDETADTYGDLDIGGNLLFDYGGRARNEEIKKKNAQILELRNQVGEERFNEIRKTVAENGGDWSQLGLDIFGEDGNKLDDFYSDVQGKDQKALEDLLSGLGDFHNSADYFDNPNFMGDVGDVTNAAMPSEQTVGAQRDALAQYKNLSNPNESAQEKLLRAMATREMEANMRGDREAMNRSLKARGVYGSGAEITGNLMSQAEHANRRSLENMQANALAGKRAEQALGSYSDLAAKMRQSETQEGSLANQVAQFNNATNQNLSNLRGTQQVAATQAGEAAKGQRAVQGFTGTTNVNNAQRSDVNAGNTTKTNYTQGKTNDRTRGSGMVVGALDREEDKLKEAWAANEAQVSSGGILG